VTTSVVDTLNPSETLGRLREHEGVSLSNLLIHNTTISYITRQSTYTYNVQNNLHRQSHTWLSTPQPTVFGIPTRQSVQTSQDYDVASPNIPYYDPFSPTTHNQLIQPPNQCWEHATNLLPLDAYVDQEGLEAGTICAKIPKLSKTILALEISKCQMRDFGEHLFRGNDTDICHDTLNESNVAFCLQRLTELGFLCYLNYNAYVGLLCIRLMQYRIIQMSKESQLEISSRSNELAAQNLKLLEDLNAALRESSILVNEVSQFPEKVVHSVLNSSNYILGGVKQALNDAIARENDSLMDIVNKKVLDVVQKQSYEKFGELHTLLDQMLVINENFDKNALKNAEHYALVQKVISENNDELRTLFDQRYFEITLYEQFVSMYNSNLNSWGFTMDIPIRVLVSLAMIVVVSLSSPFGTNMKPVISFFAVLQILSEPYLHALEYFNIISNHSQQLYVSKIRTYSAYFHRYGITSILLILCIVVASKYTISFLQRSFYHERNDDNQVPSNVHLESTCLNQECDDNSEATDELQSQSTKLSFLTKRRGLRSRNQL
jgi:hypothetical protein